MPYRPVIKSLTQFHNWVFGQGTRVVEFINTVMLIAFTLPFFYNFELILVSKVYSKFYFAGSSLWWFGMIVLGFIQMYAMIKKGLHANQVSGYILILSSWVWAIIAAIFVASSPPITTAPIVYTVISFVCAAAGLYLLKYNKAIEDLYHKGR